MIERFKAIWSSYWNKPAGLRKHVLPAYILLVAVTVGGMWQTNRLGEQRAADANELTVERAADVTALLTAVCEKGEATADAVREVLIDIALGLGPNVQALIFDSLERGLPDDTCRETLDDATTTTEAP